MNSYKSIIKADYLQRTRSYGFLVTLLVSVCLAYTFVPATGANYSTVRVGNFIGENNAAWIGHVTAIMASTFLWLFGYYLVNNGIKRDIDTGVGQIVATTSISNFKYLLAKALSNFFVLLTITVIVMVMALILVVMRGRDYPFDFKQFFFPYILTTIPSIFFVSVLAVFAEVIAGKYTNLQNIGFFILFIIIINITNTAGPGIHWFDVLGTRALTDGMAGTVNSQYSNTLENVSVGFIFSDQINAKYFIFRGTNWPVDFILGRFVWIVIAFLMLLIAGRIFHRFDVKERDTTKKKRKNADIIETGRSLKEIHLSSIPVATTAYGIWPFIKIEFRMLIRKGPKWFWVINLGGFIALFFMPLTPAHQIGLPVLWFLQINRWSDIVTKERYYRTNYFTYAAYKPLQRLLTSQILSGILLSTAFAFPVIFRYVINGEYSTVISIILGAIFIISLSVFSGIISGGSRLYEIVFFMLTYANISVAPGLDYFGAFNHGIAYMAIMSGIICTVLFIAFMFRKFEIRNQ
ncbi:MAG: hypothetical protein ABI760_11685 [Ferruginibacter sp.]